MYNYKVLIKRVIDGDTVIGRFGVWGEYRAEVAVRAD